MIQRILVIALLLSGLFLLNPLSASAFDPFSPTTIDCSGKEAKSAVCNTTNTDPISGTDGILNKVTAIIAYVAGIAAVIIIIVSGISFITANGDANKISNARRMLIYALIGLVVIILAKAIVTYVIVRL